MSDTVTVESNASQVETENSTISATVTGQAIFELPLNGRNTLDLLKTQPGISATNPDSGAAGNYSIGGMRTDSVTYLLDGGLNNNLLDNGVVANPNPDAIAEFRVLENNYSAEYGRNAGGIVSVVTKSGTNQFHGTAFDYVRNNFFDANTFFNNQQNLPVPVLKRNQFGGTVGGPIVKNKLFFFFSYEGQRQISLDVSPGKVTAFTPAEANGDFSQSSGQANVSCFLTGVTGCPLTAAAIRLQGTESLLSIQSCASGPGHHRSCNHRSGSQSISRAWVDSDLSLWLSLPARFRKEQIQRIPGKDRLHHYK